MKKIISLSLCAMMALSLSLTGCKPATEPTKAGPTAAPAAKKAEPINVSIALSVSSPQTENTPVQKYVEEAVNAKFKLIPLGGWGDYVTKMNLLMSSPDTMPNLLWKTGMNAEFEQWKKNGQLVDLLPLLKQNGKNILKYYSKDTLWYYYDNGKMFALPGDVAEEGAYTLWLRKDWMDKLGLKVPKTTEELVTVLKAFAANDPDGNGKADTYGLSGYQWNYGSTQFELAYGIRNNQWIVQPDGSVKYGAVMPEMKEVLKIMQDLYKEKAIDPNAVTWQKKDVEVFANGKFGAMYGPVAFNNPSFPRRMDLEKNNPGAQWIAVDLPAGPKGFSADEPSAIGGWCQIAMTTSSKDPAAVMGILDKFATPQVFKLRVFGKEGEQYKVQNGKFEFTIPAEERAKNGIDLFTHFINRKDAANVQNTPETTDLFAKRAKSSQPMRERVYFPKNAADTPKWTKYQPDSNTLVQTYFGQIISGQKDIAEFEKFVQEWYTKGGKDAELEVNAQYKKEKAEYQEWSKYYDSNLKP